MKPDWTGISSLVLAALTALAVAAVSWGVNGQKIEQLQRDVTNINIRLDRLESFRIEQASESQVVQQMARDITEIKGDVKELGAKIDAPKKRGK